MFKFKKYGKKLLQFKALQMKLADALNSALPIIVIVLLLAFTIAPMPNSILLAFIFGAGMLILGTMFFSLGADVAMDAMGQNMGSRIMKTRKLPLILGCGLALGILITMSEPDLVVLANQITSVPNRVLIYSVAIGVGIFIVIALLRTILGVKLRTILLICYGVAFILMIFTPKSFLAVAFDAGGSAGGPMTIPFIMAFGLGVSSMRSDKNAGDDSFGMVSLATIGPIIAVLLLGIIYNPEEATYSSTIVPDITDSIELAALFNSEIPATMKSILIALLPITIFFSIFQFILLRLDVIALVRIIVGLVYTFIGLVVFLAGVNVGFIPAGSYLGTTIASLEQNWIIVPVGMLIGFFIVKAEPAVGVLMKQVEEQTNGAIAGKTLQNSLSIGVCISVGISMIRVLTGISVVWPLVIGYVIVFILTFFVSPMFVGIAFDSGGVASGPMTATFLLPMSMGACIAVGGNVVTDAFGVVAMVSMTPLIVIQLLGLKYDREIKGSSGQIIHIDDEFAIIEL